MNIGIYGHSVTVYKREDPNHFITMVKNYFQSNIVHTGTPQCSEERTLFELKKTKNLDFAIIFHSPPYNIFVPAWNRDITNVEKETFFKKVSMKKWIKDMGLCNDDELDYNAKILESVPNGTIFQMLEHFGIDFENYAQAFDDWVNGDDTDLKKLIMDHARQTSDAKFYEELYNALFLRKKYLDHPDLQMNRYYGAIIQIDQYLKSKKIPCIHFLDKESWYPKWMEFTSGPVDTEIQKMQSQTGPYYVGYHKSDNGLSIEANKIIFERIVELAAGAGFEPAITDRQSAALPLGYPD